jgi:hypothetical protein
MSSPFPQLTEWLKKWYKREAVSNEDAFLHYAYTRTLIKVLNESKLFVLFPDKLKTDFIKLFAMYITSEDTIKTAIKNKENKCTSQEKKN